MLQGAFLRLLRDDENEAQRIYHRVISFLVYVEKRKGLVKRKKFTLADAAEEMEREE